MRTGLIAAVVVALVVGGSALALAKDGPSSGGSQAAQSGSFKKVTKVDIKDFKFAPPKDEVKVGQKIEVTNEDTAKHTLTSQPQGTFDSGDLSKGQTKSITFKKPGTYSYYCVYHAFMTGKVKVVK